MSSGFSKCKIWGVACFFAVVLVILSLSSCESDTRTDTQKIEDRVSAFVSEYNSGNAEGMFECFDKRSRKKFETIYGVIGKIFSLIPYVGNVIDFADIFALSFTVSDEEILKINIKEIVMIDENNATVIAEMGYKLGYFGFDHMDEQIEVYLPMVKEKGDWYIKNLTEDIRSVNVKEYVKLIATKRDAFDGGISEISFTQNGIPKRGLVNRDGRILYSVDQEANIEFHIMETGYCLIEDGERKLIIDQNGVYRELGIDFSSVLATGGGYALLYQEKNCITHIEHLYAVINSMGEERMPFVALPNYSDMLSYSYVGDGIFTATQNSSDGAEIIFFDQHSKSIYKIAGDRVKHGSFEDGVSFGFGGETVTYYSENKRATLPLYYRLEVGGKIQESERITNVLDGGALSVKDGHYKIIKDDHSFVYDTFTTEYITNVVCRGDYSLITLLGVDGTEFFTVADAKGKELFEPIAYVDDVRIYDGIVVYKTQTQIYASIDFKGETLIAPTDEFSFIGAFSDGIAPVIYKGKHYHVNKSGEMILFDLSLSK